MTVPVNNESNGEVHCKIFSVNIFCPVQNTLWNAENTKKLSLDRGAGGPYLAHGLIGKCARQEFTFELMVHSVKNFELLII